MAPLRPGGPRPTPTVGEGKPLPYPIRKPFQLPLEWVCDSKGDTLGTPDDAAQMSPRVDESYYPKSSAWFQIENTIFKVCRQPFEDYSTFFRDKLSSSGSDHDVGSTHANPLKLDDVTIAEFRDFMRLIWKPAPGQPDPVLTQGGWVSVLKLSTKWEFLDLRKMAIEKLDDLLNCLIFNYVEMIRLAQTYHVDKWVLTVINGLAQRRAALSGQEFDALGVDTALKILRVRQRYTHRCGQYCKNGQRPSGLAPLMQKIVLQPAHVRATPNPLLPANAPPPIPQECDRREYDFRKDIIEIFGLENV